MVKSCPTLGDPEDLKPARLLCPWDFPGKNTVVGCHSLPQGIFPTQESNLGLSHCRRILYQLFYQWNTLARSWSFTPNQPSRLHLDNYSPRRRAQRRNRPRSIPSPLGKDLAHKAPRWAQPRYILTSRLQSTGLTDTTPAGSEAETRLLSSHAPRLLSTSGAGTISSRLPHPGASAPEPGLRFPEGCAEAFLVFPSPPASLSLVGPLSTLGNRLEKQSAPGGIWVF